MTLRRRSIDPGAASLNIHDGLRSRFGHDLSRVRLHSGRQAAAPQGGGQRGGQASALPAAATPVASTSETCDGSAGDRKSPPGLTLCPPERPKRSHGPSPEPPVIQPKLVVGSANDPLEYEADRMADHVMRMRDPAAEAAQAVPSVGSGADLQRCSCGKSRGGSGDCEECKAAAAGIQRAAADDSSADVAPPIVHEVLREPGRPLDTGTRHFMESRFGRDFSGVRVHTGAKAAGSAGAVSALAYTAGRDIVFAERQYAPDNPAGLRLLAHELSHVVQQGSSPAKPAAGSEEERGESMPAAGERQSSVLRRTCGPTDIGTHADCATSTDANPPGDLVRFKVNCDDYLTADEEKKVKDFADSMETGERVVIHGFASVDGPAQFNQNLSCARAERARETLVTDGIDRAKIDIVRHGPTPGVADARRSVVLERVPGRSRPAAPQLQGAVVSGPTVEDCGGEKFVIRWSLSRPSAAAGGFVIQDVNFNWRVTDCAGAAVPTPPFVSPLRYFEAWRVPPNTEHPHATAFTVDTDQFTWPSNPPWGGGCSDGTATIVATAIYHDNVATLPGHMTPFNPDTFANDLPSSRTDPALGGTASRPFAHALKIHWKCCPCQSSPTVVDSHTP